MAERIVVDASVAVAFLREEERTADVVGSIQRWVREGAELFVPSLFWLEVLNVLVRRHGWDAASVMEGVLVLDRLQVRTVELDRPLLLLAAGEMEARGLTAYDAAYLASARSLDARLATLDDRLARAADDRAVRFGPRPGSIAEPAAAYPRPEALAAWAHSAIVGAHIAELRARAASAPGRSEPSA